MNNFGITEALKIIYENLPLYAEECGEFDSENIRTLIEGSGVNVSDQMETCIQLVEKLFTSVNVLDHSELKKGCWRFKSFPASLMAKSLLSNLMDPNQSLYPSAFWSPQNEKSKASEDQRSVLKYLENGRNQNSQSTPNPIRSVHVAWGLISVEGKFLMHHREDQTRHEQGDWVLVGGKVTQNDLIVAQPELQAFDAIKLLQSPAASDLMDGIEVALKREISEETDLIHGLHYHYTPWESLKPYTNIGGAAAIQVLTEYRIHVFKIELTLEGLLALHKKVNSEEELTWFTLDEMISGQSKEGRKAYIPALTQHFGPPERWASTISNVTSSYVDGLANVQDSLSITASISNSTPIQVGKTGKEKNLNCSLTEEEHDLFLSLCLYAKSSLAVKKSDKINLLNAGWMELNDPELQAIAQSLTTKLKSSNAPVLEGYKDRFYRIALPPNYIFFENQAFAYTLKKTESDPEQVVIIRQAIHTSLIELEEHRFYKNTGDPKKKDSLKALLDNPKIGEDIVHSGTFKKFKQRLASEVNEFGLRGFIRSVDTVDTVVIDKCI